MHKSVLPRGVHVWGIALLLLPLVSAASLQASAVQVSSGKSPVTVTRRALSGQHAAEQLALGVDAGDSYLTPRGERRLLRLAGAVALQVKGADPVAVLSRLTMPGGALTGYRVAVEAGAGIAVLKGEPDEQQRHMRVSTALGKRLSSVRRDPGAGTANPVFIDPESGLSQIVTGEIILRLKPDTDAQSCLGSLWPAARRLRGTRSQYVLTLPDASAEKVFAEVNRWMADPRVEWAEPNLLEEVARHFTPDDPGYPDQWHLDNTGQSGGTANADLQAPEAWDRVQGTREIVIAIIDDGVEIDHPDLATNIFDNVADPVNGLDDDGNGYTDDCHGWNYFSDTNNPSPEGMDDNHGTATAGLAAARGNNGIGVSGMAPRCRIMPLKIMGGGGYSAIAWIAEAIRYAGGVDERGSPVWRGADVISMSLGMSWSAAINNAIVDAALFGRNGKGCPIFVSSGNSATAWWQYTVSGIEAGSHTFRWEYAKDFMLSQGQDSVWLDSVAFPGGARETFEGGGLPTGWTTGGDAPWYNVRDGVGGNHAVTGWNGPGSRALRSGDIEDNEFTFVEVSRTVAAGSMAFWGWVSTESDYDLMRFYVDGEEKGADSGPWDWHLNTQVAYPAMHPYTIAVGASTDFDYRADYSQYGSSLDFVAPSGGGAAGVRTTDRTGANGYNAALGAEGQYFSGFSGTSASCPLAAGVGALILSVNPGLTATQLRAVMRDTCDKVGGVAYSSGRNDFYGYGRINAYNAIRLATPSLEVFSSHGVGAPAEGVHLLPYGTNTTCAITNSPLYVGALATQYVCIGWTGAGSVPAGGTTTGTPSFAFTRPSTIGWRWRTNYWLNTEVLGGGRVSLADQWLGRGSVVQIAATPSNHWYFVGWSGQTAGCSVAGNRITARMTQSRTMTANFALDPPELVVTSVAFQPGEPSTGATFNAVVAVKNAGTGPSGSFRVSVWTDRPLVAPDSTGEDGGADVAGLLAGQTATVVVGGLPAGNLVAAKTFRVFADSTLTQVEVNEANNQLTKRYTPKAHADFVVTSIALDPVNPAYGNTFSANVTVTNQGGAAGNGGYLHVWTNRPDVAAVRAAGSARAAVGTLGAGQGKGIRLTGLKAGMDGAKTFRAFVDAMGQTIEAMEDNNQATLSYTVIRKPDVRVTGIVLFPAVPARGGLFDAVVTVKNEGSEEAPNVLVSAWANRPAVAGSDLDLNLDGTAASSATVGTIGIGGSVSYTFSGLNVGTGRVARTFRAFADSDLSLNEVLESNNQLTKVYTPASRPDFTIIDITLSATNPAMGGNFTANVTLKNTGYVAGNAGYVDVWADRATPVTPGAALRGDRFQAAGTLNVNVTKALTFTGLPAGTNPVLRVFRAVVDSRAAVLEIVETNNQETAEYTPQP